MDDNSDSKLPPMPTCDPDHRDWKRPNYYYNTTGQDFWAHNEVVREELEDFKPCDHYFSPATQGVKCDKCHMGLIGTFEIQDGKLYVAGQSLGL